MQFAFPAVATAALAVGGSALGVAVDASNSAKNAHSSAQEAQIEAKQALALAEEAETKLLNVVTNPTTSSLFRIPIFTNENGKVIEDSSYNIATLATASTEALPLAPAGQRDTWTTTTSVSLNSGQFVYSAGFNMMWVSDVGGIHYSTDGGTTFQACVLDSATSGFVVVGFNDVLVVAFTTDGIFYTSTDGIHFSKQGTSSTIRAESYNIPYFKGTFIVSDYNTPQSTIATSSDGLTWQSQSFHGVLLDSFAQNTNVIVGVGGQFGGPQGQFVAYSLDGVNWVDSPTPLAERAESVAWSEELQQFLILTQSTGIGYTSTDGITWTSHGVIGPAGTENALIWVSKFGRWYAGAADVDGNWSLWSTPDVSIAFVGTHLNGSFIALQGQPIAYISSLDRFVMGLYADTHRIVYSTSQNVDVIALNNIRVRGMPVTVDKFSSYSTVTVSNITTETSLIPTSNIGNLVLQAAQPLGLVLHLNMFLVLTSCPSGDTLTIRIKKNGVTLWTVPLTIPTVSSPTPFKIQSSVVIAASSLALIDSYSSSFQTTAVSTSAAWNRGIQNTLTVFGQWTSLGNAFTLNQMLCTVHFPNGA
jgi:hypothetical protein